MNKMMSMGLAVVALGGCGVGTGRSDGAPARCEGTVVTVAYEAELGCDVTPPQQLDVVFDAGTRADWGGDASVFWAQEECDDMGGTPTWKLAPYRLVCRSVDF